MVSNSTQAFVLSVVDTQLDYNIKLIIFGGIIFYAFLLYRMTNQIQIDSFSKSIFYLFSKLYIYTTTFFLPLFTIMLFREYDAISLWTLILQMYGVVFVIAAFALMIFGWQKILDMFGIEYNIAFMDREKKRRGEE